MTCLVPFVILSSVTAGALWLSGLSSLTSVRRALDGEAASLRGDAALPSLLESTKQRYAKFHRFFKRLIYPEVVDEATSIFLLKIGG
jgi:hypothetical protein